MQIFTTGLTHYASRGLLTLSLWPLVEATTFPFLQSHTLSEWLSSNPTDARSCRGKGERETAVINSSTHMYIQPGRQEYMCIHWVCCVALPCCLFNLACFFLPSFSHLSLKHVLTFPLPLKPRAAMPLSCPPCKIDTVSMVTQSHTQMNGAFPV